MGSLENLWRLLGRAEIVASDVPVPSLMLRHRAPRHHTVEETDKAEFQGGTMQSQTATLTRLRYSLANFSEVVALVSFLAFFAFFAVAADNFLTPISIANILTFASITGIVSVGVAMLMISGEFDLSVGSTFAVASYIFGLSMNVGVPPILALLLALLQLCSCFALALFARDPTCCGPGKSTRRNSSNPNPKGGTSTL